MAHEVKKKLYGLEKFLLFNLNFRNYKDWYLQLHHILVCSFFEIYIQLHAAH